MRRSLSLGIIGVLSMCLTACAGGGPAGISVHAGSKATLTRAVFFNKKLTVDVPAAYKVDQSSSSPKIYIEAPHAAGQEGVEGRGMTIDIISADKPANMDRLVAGESGRDSALPGAVKADAVVQVPLGSRTFDRVDFTVNDSEHGFVLLGTDGADHIVMSCGPNSTDNYNAYEKIAFSLK